MVKTVQELTERLTQEESNQIVQLEINIDKTLEKRFQPKNQNAIAFGNLPKNYTNNGRVHTEITRRYQEAGWKVKYVYDQRDGDFLQFKPLKQGDYSNPKNKQKVKPKNKQKKNQKNVIQQDLLDNQDLIGRNIYNRFG